MAIAVAATILFAVFVGLRLLRDGAPPDERPIATRDGDRDDSLHYDNRELPLQTVATLRPTESVSRRISSTTLRVQRGTTRFDSVSGAAVRVEGPAMFGISSQSGGVLFSGSVHARLDHPESSYSVVTSNLRVVDLGTEFRVTVIDNEHVRVHVLDGEVDVQSRVRLPLYYWNFDRPRGSLDEKNAVDDAAHISLGAAARRVEGLIGSGAIDFDNTPASAVRIDDSAGDHVGEGRMACSVGITIEAVFVSRWTGKYMDYDEIFRKEDGDYRMLLSFQNDGEDYDYDFPQVEPGPCLSFGLHLEQHGYSELDMPLDGHDGRPTVGDLTDGKLHHLVATYDSFTGNKAIYIDGRLCFQHQFPRGSLIISGGPEAAEIGNFRQREPFDGVIDEVAFYDFALTPAEVAAHFKNVSLGKSYFGDMADDLTSVRWRAVTRIQTGNQRVFNRITGLLVTTQVKDESER